MIHFITDQPTEFRHNVRGGEGSPIFRHLFSKEDLGDRLDMCSLVTLQPGESIGVHPHAGNAELYYVLTGIATVTEDGQEYELFTGDAEFCADGHTHGIANRQETGPLSFLAVIMKDV